MPDFSFQPFITYCQKHIRGDEKGEAQLFLDHFFQALGYANGLKDAGADCEFRIKDPERKTTKFADLVWKPRVLIEMKKRGEDLLLHLQQAAGYWLNLVPDRPAYVILCNFDEFWIYDFSKNVNEPQDKIHLTDLDAHRQAFAFLLPKPQKPVFNTDHVDVTVKAADSVARVFASMNKRKVPREDALRYAMQCIIALFSEDVDLLPDKLFSRLLNECESHLPANADGGVRVSESYDLIGNLFREMNAEGLTPGGRYAGVDYFNGGLFGRIVPIELTQAEIGYLRLAARHDWRNVNPSIFGTIFEQGLDEGQRHGLGAHYTSEADIKKITDPVIVQPWRRRIEAVETVPIRAADQLAAYYELLRELRRFRVLDPACGSGNFLFMAYRELKLLERDLLNRIRQHAVGTTEGLRQLNDFLLTEEFVSTRQFFGLDINPYAVELAKVTLMVAKELTVLQNRELFDQRDQPLPLDNLNRAADRANIRQADALFTDWPEADVIIGNPPFQSKNNMQDEYGAYYVARVRAAYPDVPSRADFCVYWFHKAHQHLPPGGYAGLVGTNTIRQNYSRIGSLDYIVAHGGTIFNAYASFDWSGAAAVFVSVACWTKGDFPGENVLFTETPGGFARQVLPTINSSLSLKPDVAAAAVLRGNKTPKRVFQGQTHGHEGFLLSRNEARKLLADDPRNAEVLKPFLTGDELLSDPHAQPGRFVIDFSRMDMVTASTFKKPFKTLQETVLPEIQKKAEDERSGLTKANGREAWLNTWWKMWRRREDLLEELATKQRYIVCSRVTKRPIFEFVSAEIHPNDALMVFAFEDDYSFGIIHSKWHGLWFQEKCSTMKGDARYTTDSVWDTFPFPQSPTEAQVRAVADAALALRLARRKAMTDHRMSLRDLYRLLEQPGKNSLRDLHARLDEAVSITYGFGKNPSDDEILRGLLALNQQVATREVQGDAVTPPGLPIGMAAPETFVTTDCVRFLD
ncbi:MAG: N-6 DNA methylase [Cytophagaceae bacterium]|nr:N-6 DNA methylase [Cytophagaceae bacterium]